MRVETNEILQRLARVETKLDMMLENKEMAEDALKTANEALQSTKSAHRRLDTHAKVIYWAATTIIGAVIIGIISFFVRN